MLKMIQQVGKVSDCAMSPPSAPANMQTSQIMHAKFKFHSPKWDSVSSDSKDFIMKCLTV